MPQMGQDYSQKEVLLCGKTWKGPIRGRSRG